MAVKKVLISQKTKKKYFVTDTKEEFITSEGVISAKDLQSKKEEVESNKGKRFYLLKPSLADKLEKLKRAPQIIVAKDIGLIIAKTGVNKDSIVVDAGVGSGALALSLSHICKKVTAYEVNGAHLEVAEKNKFFFGASNLTIKKGDIAKKLTEKNIDLITLDLPHPWEVIAVAEKSLKRGGYLVIYLPNLLQLRTFYAALKGSPIKFLETIELIERKWKIEDTIMRPETNMVGHTAFLTFCRKL